MKMYITFNLCNRCYPTWWALWHGWHRYMITRISITDAGSHEYITSNQIFDSHLLLLRINGTKSLFLKYTLLKHTLLVYAYWLQTVNKDCDVKHPCSVVYSWHLYLSKQSSISSCFSMLCLPRICLSLIHWNGKIDRVTALGVTVTCSVTTKQSPWQYVRFLSAACILFVYSVVSMQRHKHTTFIIQIETPTR